MKKKIEPSIKGPKVPDYETTISYNSLNKNRTQQKSIRGRKTRRGNNHIHFYIFKFL